MLSLFYITEITVIVERTLASGLQGTVRVSYSTLTPLQAYPHLPGGTARGSDTDYVISSGHVDFSPNVTSQRFNVTVLDDDVPEIEETFFVLLTSVELLEGAQDRTGDCKFRPVGCKRVYLLLQVADTPFHIKGGEICTFWPLDP